VGGQGLIEHLPCHRALQSTCRLARAKRRQAAADRLRLRGDQSARRYRSWPLPGRQENFLHLPNPAGTLRVRGHQSRERQGHTMEQKSTKTSDFNRVVGDAKTQASTAARKTMGSLEQAIRNTIETQPYTAAAIALGLGWLLGCMHRPL